ncbi:MAG: hypothetical protein JJ956_18420 [Pseudomonadales bacterium]|nr:hypothetical protein [Pseudomonadales bacterium]
MNYSEAVEAISDGKFEQLFHVSFLKNDELRCCVMRINDDLDAPTGEIMILEEIAPLFDDFGHEDFALVGNGDERFHNTHFYDIPGAEQVIGVGTFGEVVLETLFDEFPIADDLESQAELKGYITKAKAAIKKAKESSWK